VTLSWGCRLLEIEHMTSLWRARRLWLALGLALACGAAGPASAQFLQPYFHGYRYELPPDDEELPRYGSRRAVARILGRAGFELVSAGPPRRRGRGDRRQQARWSGAFLHRPL
jgi:hypothetical protein